MPRERPNDVDLIGDRTAVVRRGGVVHRATGPWAPTVHRLLRHLADRGFEGCPAVVGGGFDEQGRETLTFIEGAIRHPEPWHDHQLVAVAQLVRRVHEASESFTIPGEAAWRPWFGRMIGMPDIIGHCDIAPWNIILRDDRPIALIDWEAAGPVCRLTELAMMVWTCVQLYDDDLAERNGLPPVGIRVAQVRLVLDAYGLPRAERSNFGDRLIQVAVAAAANEAVEAGVGPDTSDATALWGITWRVRSAAWLLRHRAWLAAV